MKGTALASALLILAEGSGVAPPAAARERSYRIAIPAGPLGSSLARFSEITGISVGLPGDMPRTRTPGVTGILSAEAALRKLLEGSGLRARRMGGIYRLERIVMPTATPEPAPVVAPRAAAPLPDIVVTAQKRPQMLASVPLSLSVISPDPLAIGSQTPASWDVSLNTEGLAMTNLGPGRNRQFIRGVADSPFNGHSQSTVAVQVDDARVTFDAPDPNLRLIDIDRVEILKGPQGPLYGPGALGGIYHIVTRRPDLDQASLTERFSTEGVEHGGIGTGIEAIVNVPLVADRLALRGVGYRLLNAGWINNRDGRKNSNASETAGLRLALRWHPADHWTIDAGITVQDIKARDSQYVLSNTETLTRDNRFAEPSDTDFKLAHVTIEGDVGEFRLLSTTSYVDHDFDYVLDASRAAASFGLTGAARFADNRAYSLFNQELRLSSSGANRWLAGLSYLRATTRGISTISGQSGDPQIVATLDRSNTEYAVFGEATWPLLGKLNGTVGARLFQAISRDETAALTGPRAQQGTETIISPSATLFLPMGGKNIVYLRYAHAMRPGGLTPTGEDELSAIDLGIRRASADGRLSLSASTYFTLWSEIQSDYLLSNGLVATRNAGRGRIYGIEAALDWRLGTGLHVSVGGSAQRARLTHAEDGLELEDRRLPVTPSLTARLAVTKTVRFAQWKGRATLQANYIGSARLSFDSDLDRAMGQYAVLGARSEFSRGPWTIGAGLDNLSDIKGDSFSFGNPFSIRDGRQFTPVRPRTLMLSIARHW